MAGVQIDGVNNKIDFDDDLDTSISANTDDTLVFEIAGATDFTMTANTFTAASGSTITSPSIKTPLIEFTDGDDAITIADGGGVTFPIASTFTLGFTSNAASTITTADNTAQLTLKSTDADASVGPDFVLQRDSGSPADDDSLGRIRFVADNDAGEALDHISINASIRDASDGTEDAQLTFNMLTAGAVVDAFHISPTETVFNDASADRNFRIESNDDAVMFVVDGENNRIGIGTNTPARTVQIVDSSATPYLSIVGPNNAGAGIMLGDTDDETVGRITYDNSDNGMQFWTNDAEQVRIHSNGVLSASDGIALGVGTANTASNVLDDYEEGTWTLGITDGSSNTATLGSGYNYGRYRKVGSIVHIQGFLDVSSIGSCSGNITLTGLPFAVPAGSQYYGHIVMVHATGLSRSSGQNLTGYPAENSSNITLKTWDVSTGTSTLQANELANGEFIFGGSYMVA